MYDNVVWAGMGLVVLGVFGVVVNSRHMIVMLMALELMLLGVSVILSVYGMWLDDIVGQLVVLVVLTVAGAESAIGLGILVSYHRLSGTIGVCSLNVLRG